MSQAKVNRYKEEKANRKALMKRDRMKSLAWKGGFALAGVMLVVWIGYSGYSSYQKQKPAEKAEVDYTSFTSFSEDISAAAESQ